MNDSIGAVLLEEFRAFRADVNSWKLETSERLATLETQIKDVVGNGQPGRLSQVEKKVSQHSRLIWIASGALFAVEAAFTALASWWAGHK
jgi:hypothetical protein